MNRIIKINLTPLSVFFFGGEKSLADPDEQNYLVKSRYIPQQTTLLGLLRFELLRQNGFIRDVASGHKLDARAVELIGNTGFPSDDYKKIKCISPVFFEKEDEPRGDDHWFIRPLDATFKYLGHYRNGKVRLLNNLKNGLPILENYDPKKEYPTTLVCKNGGIMEMSSIFHEQLQTGINKKKVDEAYYKQTYLKLDRGWSFAFYVLMEDGGFSFRDNITWMGGERSMFKMKVTPIKDHVVEMYWKFPFMGPVANGSASKVVLHSPAYIEGKYFDSFDFALSRVLPFKYLKSVVTSTNRYYNRSKNKDMKNSADDMIKRSELIELFDIGSVFYFTDNKRVKEFVDNMKIEYSNIGYNYYSIENI